MSSLVQPLPPSVSCTYTDPSQHFSHRHNEHLGDYLVMPVFLLDHNNLAQSYSHGMDLFKCLPHVR